MCALAEHLSQSEIELPLRNTCYYSPLAEVGVSTQTEMNERQKYIRKEANAMKQIDTQKLAAKIKTEYGISEQAAFEKAAQIQLDCPEQLVQNVYEWVEERPLW